MPDSGVRYAVGKISTRATTSVQTSSRSEVGARSYALPKSRESRTGTLGWISGLQLGSPGNLCHLDVGAAERRRVYYRGVWWWHTPEPGVWCVQVSPSARGLSLHQKGLRMDFNQLVLVCDAGSCNLKA